MKGRLKERWGKHVEEEKLKRRQMKLEKEKEGKSCVCRKEQVERASSIPGIKMKNGLKERWKTRRKGKLQRREVKLKKGKNRRKESKITRVEFEHKKKCVSVR